MWSAAGETGCAIFKERGRPACHPWTGKTWAVNSHLSFWPLLCYSSWSALSDFVSTKTIQVYDERVLEAINKSIRYLFVNAARTRAWRIWKACNSAPPSISQTGMPPDHPVGYNLICKQTGARYDSITLHNKKKTASTNFWIGFRFRNKQTFLCIWQKKDFLLPSVIGQITTNICKQYLIYTSDM